MSATKEVARATVDVGTTFATGGQVGLIIYALLLFCFILLVRDVMLTIVGRAERREQARADRELAASLTSVAIQLARVESAVGVQEARRASERGDLPRGALPSPQPEASS